MKIEDNATIKKIEEISKSIDDVTANIFLNNHTNKLRNDLRREKARKRIEILKSYNLYVLEEFTDDDLIEEWFDEGVIDHPEQYDYEDIAEDDENFEKVTLVYANLLFKHLHPSQETLIDKRIAILKNYNSYILEEFTDSNIVQKWFDQRWTVQPNESNYREIAENNENYARVMEIYASHLCEHLALKQIKQ